LKIPHSLTNRLIFDGMSQPFVIREATAPLVPIILSIPHCGIDFPEEIRSHYLEDQLAKVDDTDFFLQDLYNFAPEMGITTIYAKYSRWVIDLNRDPDSKPLYDDGRIITALTPITDFLGNPIYRDSSEPDQKEVDRRLKAYYWPYYQKISELLEERRLAFGHALLWDAHSIREQVLTIQAEKFPEMILGNNDERSSNADLIEISLNELSKKYVVNHNNPFKGGHITRYFGNPSAGISALQLERNKNLYMDDSEREFQEERANGMREVLKSNFEKLINSESLS
jgi:N-formylglutamate deformylase